MSSLETLLAEYVAEHRSGGEADPLTFLNRAAPQERVELAALIDAYLARSERRPFDEEGFSGSPSEAAVEELHRAITGASGMWPVLLPRLRRRAGVKRRELVERLARMLDLGTHTEKVGRYYHEMEQGLLPARGVSDRVLEALATMLGASAAALRDAGEAPAGALDREPDAGPAFARVASAEVLADSSAPSLSAPAEEHWDAADELFRGGI